MSTLKQFLTIEASAGLALLAAAALAIIADNSSLAPFYDQFLTLKLTVAIGGFGIEKPLLLWINDGLMAIFFFLVGLEIKREVIDGELSSVSQVALPAVAAIGGMVVPAAIYLAFNSGDPSLVRGWAIPTATDIAFALGILMLLGKRVPLALKVFLTTVAVFDDLGAIVIIALFFTHEVSGLALTFGIIGLGVCYAFNRMGIVRKAPFILVGLVVWTCFLKSGVHATLAGVALALTIPLTIERGSKAHSPLRELEHGLHPWVAFLVLPAFAFANAGVNLGTLSLDSGALGLPLGIAAGLVIGKQIGVFGATWAMIRFGIARMPSETNWAMLYGVSILCGIGFTMSLFIGGLAFDDPALTAGVRVGVLSGSIISGVAGYLFLRRVLDRSRATSKQRNAGMAMGRVGQETA